MTADAARPAYDDFVKAAESDPNDPRTLEGLIRASAPLRREADTRAVLERLAADPTHQPAKLALGRLLASQGHANEAVRLIFGILQGDPGNVAGARSDGLGSLRRRRRRAHAARGRPPAGGGTGERSRPLLQRRVALHGEPDRPGDERSPTGPGGESPARQGAQPAGRLSGQPGSARPGAGRPSRHRLRRTRGIPRPTPIWPRSNCSQGIATGRRSTLPKR